MLITAFHHTLVLVSANATVVMVRNVVAATANILALWDVPGADNVGILVYQLRGRINAVIGRNALLILPQIQVVVGRIAFALRLSVP